MQRDRAIYPVKDSHSYITPYNQRDHSWSHDQHDQSNEVQFVNNTKTLHSDYAHQLEPTATHHLIDGLTGVPSADASNATTALYQYNPQFGLYMS